jgi:hypothetical protein
MGLRLYRYISRSSEKKSRGNSGVNSRMAGGLDEEQAAVNTGILDVTLTLSSEFLAEVRRVLILDVLDNGVPANTQLATCRQ